MFYCENRLNPCCSEMISKCISRTGIGQTNTCPPYTSFGKIYTKKIKKIRFEKYTLGPEILAKR